ncbi:SulP family inorganic anion transporter [Rhodococcus sp. SGAir0479]|uniref:SulP family inorganic anion transporter n=1 Tax=Rhodococcus sp. SGAir0479 TaxID=2567884 RepID=UPI0010CD6C0D|nr:SulP family inorganic anion transporter [Rhodococcus sp. SGAir0479]QCQ93383.1 SulP family inorganic anion transporter [Rhodococcus sp. SGAir0479]
MARVVGALRSWVRSRLPERRTFKNDLIAGIPGAISSVPDGMAAGVLAGVNPVHGLYASFAGPVFGGLQTSTKLMVVTTTSAAALAAGSAVADVPESDRSGAIVLLTLIAGAIMVAAALLRLGRFTRFVSHSVMTGFLTGIAVNIVLGQVPDLAGADAGGSVAVTKFFDVVANPSGVDWRALVTGVTALLVLVLAARTRLALFGSLLALVVPGAVVIGFGWDGVARVSDVGAIPTGLPLPVLPDPGLLSFELLSGALAVAVIVLVQGAGVAESAPNLDGSRSDSDVDFSAQGVGNVGAALFGGMPVGGSVGQTALNATSGARGRWGAVWSGIWMLVILVVLAGVVGKVPMPTLAAVLIVAAVGSIRPRQILEILRTGPTSQIAVVTTFVATLLLPVAAAVGIGVALSLLLQLNQEAVDLSVVELVPGDNGTLRERPAPRRLTAGQVLVLDVYGSLFYAGARTLQARLPDPADATNAEVILRLRGRTTFGATFFSVIRDYARRLDAENGRLYLSGIGAQAADDWGEERLAGLGLALEVFPATETIGESTRRAFGAAERRRVRVTERAGG